MRIDATAVLIDFLERVTRGDLALREQLNVIEACAYFADDTLVDHIVRLAESERTAPEARIKTLEILARMRPEACARLTTTFLARPDVELQRRALRLAKHEWFSSHAALCTQVGELAIRAPEIVVRQAAQEMLATLPVSDAGTARTLLQVWLDEPNPGLKGMFHTQLRDMAEADEDRVAVASDVLVRSFAPGHDNRNDWLLLGRVRTEGGAVKAQGAPMLSRIRLSWTARSAARDIKRPTWSRSFVYALAAMFAVILILWPFGLDRLKTEELVTYFIVAAGGAVLLSRLFSRLSVPANLVPERLSLIPSEVTPAILPSLLVALVSSTMLENFAADEPLIELDWSWQRLIFHFLLLVSAFVSVRFTGLAAYGLAENRTYRWRVQSISAAVTGCAVLLLTCAINPQPTSIIEPLVLLFIAPTLLTLAMTYAELDNESDDRGSQGKELWRPVALTPAAVVVVLAVAAIAYGFSKETSFSKETKGTEQEERLFSVDRLTSDNPTLIRLGEALKVESTYNQRIDLVAQNDEVDIQLFVLDFERKELDSADDPEKLSFRFWPGKFMICVGEFDTEDCDGATPQLTGLRSFAAKLLPSGFARLTVTGGLSTKDLAALEEFDNWIAKLNKASPSDSKATAKVGYFIAAQNLKLSSRDADTQHAGNRRAGAQTSQARAGEQKTVVQSRSIRLAKGSVLYRAGIGKPLVVVQGMVHPAVSQFIPKEQMISRDRLVPLPEQRPPSPDRLELTGTVQSLVTPRDLVPVTSAVVLELLRHPQNEPFSALIKLLLTPAGKTSKDTRFVAALDTFRGRGAGVFRLTGSRSDDSLRARLVYGWDRYEDTMTNCYILHDDDIGLKDDTWNPNWETLVNVLSKAVEPPVEKMAKVNPAERNNDRYCDSPAIKWSHWTNAQAMLNRKGEFFEKFAISPRQKDEPRQFRHLYVITAEEGEHDGYLPLGTIIRGRSWQDDGSPEFDVIFGYSNCDETCFVEYDALTYLGPVFLTEYKDIPNLFKREVWTDEQRKSFNDAEFIDRHLEFPLQK